MDLNFGAGNNTPTYNFTSGLNPASTDYGSLNLFGMGVPQQGTGSLPGMPSSAGIGMNLPTLQLGLSGLSTLANLYTGLKSLGLAQDQFSFNKDMTQKNYANSVASYNTALTDKANARAVTEGQSTAARDAYINANRLN
ncbi:hypothetical protein [Paraburkholderia sp. SIMBA_054]|uniref:hypothetical protein n=1 Tax=Paraburkholderia sp. SIMBA_054 TaxID=3085795 RepID=UPI003979FB31